MFIFNIFFSFIFIFSLFLIISIIMFWDHVMYMNRFDNITISFIIRSCVIWIIISYVININIVEISNRSVGSKTNTSELDGFIGNINIFSTINIYLNIMTFDYYFHRIGSIFFIEGSFNRDDRAIIVHESDTIGF